MRKNILQIDYNYMFDTYLGKGNGVSEEIFASNKGLALKAFDTVAKKRGTGWMKWCDLPYNQNEIIEDIINVSNEIRDNYESFVVFGIGGSALGPNAVFNSLCHLRHNELPSNLRKAPKFYVEDNVDPERMASLLDVIDVRKTMFNIVSKSGATSETMSQYLIIIDILKKKLKDKFSENVIVTTDLEKGNLIKLSKKEGFKAFFVPDGVGGRFSELCPVGLLPACVLGIDIREILEGAKMMDEKCKQRDVEKNPALALAYLSYLSMKGGKNISVVMPYADKLRLMGDWFCQLWAESLGKKITHDGKVVSVGQTPVKSLGVTDQHSQLQLYQDGPNDKTITFIGVENFSSYINIPESGENMADIDFLCGHTLNELISTERKATEYALMKAGKANCTILLDEVSPFSIGELIWLFQMQTAFCGEMLCVNPYDQPGVENSKNATYAMFNRNGYEELAKEISNAKPKNIGYIID